MTKQIIFIESNIGVGKTTAINHIKASSDKFLLLEEPVDHWQNVPTMRRNEAENNAETEAETTEPENLNLLEHFYQDLGKYSFCFQTYTFLSRMKLLLEAIKSLEANDQINTIVCERSIFTDREIFLKGLVESGHITAMEEAVYFQLWNFWIDLMKPYFKDVSIKFLYLQCAPEKALEHRIERGRTEESNVDLNYLKLLDRQHHQLYVKNQTYLKELVKVLTNSNKVQVDYLENTGDLETYLQQVAEYFSQV